MQGQKDELERAVIKFQPVLLYRGDYNYLQERKQKTGVPLTKQIHFLMREKFGAIHTDGVAAGVEK